MINTTINYILIFLFFLGLASCSETIEKPKNLVDENTMAELIAEFAINDQLGMLNQKGNMEISSKYILDKYKIKGADFAESHAYYISIPNKMESIYDKAQEILLEREPNLRKDIEKKIQENASPIEKENP